MAGQFHDEDWQQDDEAAHRLERSLNEPQGRPIWVINHPAGFAVALCSILSILLGAWLIAAGAALTTALAGTLSAFIPGVVIGVPFARYWWRRQFPGSSN